MVLEAADSSSHACLGTGVMGELSSFHPLDLESSFAEGPGMCVFRG